MDKKMRIPGISTGQLLRKAYDNLVKRQQDGRDGWPDDRRVG